MFQTCYNYFEYRVIFFKLINTFIIFQLYINIILRDLLNILYIIYLNDILIFLKSKKEYIIYIKKIFKRLYYFSLYTKLSKCEFIIT